MRLYFVTFAILAATLLWGADEVFTNEHQVANNGYDVVTYFYLQQGKPAVKGNPDISLKHEGVIYHFTTQDHRNKFMRNPKKFLPQYGGYCAYAVAVADKKVAVDPNAWFINNGKLYLNKDQAVQKLWLNNKEAYIQEANKNWPKIREASFQAGWFW